MKRIKRIAELIKPYKNIADVGCDHGYLIIEAFENNNILKAIGIDNKEGPLNRAILNIKNKPYYDNVKFSLSSGIKCIDDETEVIIIAGMGGLSIVEILSDDIKNTKRIITQANKDNYLVRKKINSLGFEIKEEIVIYESGKYYEVISFDKVSNPCVYNEFQYEFGPILALKKSLEYLRMLEDKLIRLENIPVKTDDIKEKIKNIKFILGG